MPAKGDPNSFSNPEECHISHIHLNLTTDFSKQVLFGYAELTIHITQQEAKSVNLDCNGLNVKNISNKGTGEKMVYTLEDTGVSYGSKLVIQLPEVPPAQTYVIKIEYSSSPDASALQWLTPEQTAGKKHPYMFSHCQPVNARSVVPCQDTPQVKFTYTAEISAPADLTVLMSGVRDGVEDAGDPQMKTFKFVQKIPIPSYLIAFAVGALESRKIGPISHVWAEKEYVDKAAFEFSEAGKMLKIAEELLGPYVWGIYDILTLPPSFPVGGTEHPCVTFLTPTLLAGDRSLAYVVAHEIIHSWIGNLVTNRNFEHFWLNEGFTMFVERKIKGLMHGESSRHFAAISEWKRLEYEVEAMGKDNALTKLVPNLTGVHPDEAKSIVPYEKGHTFLFYLEQLLGGAEVFDAFLRAYIEKYKGQSLDTDDWKAYLYEYFHDKKAILDKVDWDAWLYTPGMPPVKPDYDASLAVKCRELCTLWMTEKLVDSFSLQDIKGFSSPQVQEFLNLLLKEDPLSEEKMKHLTEVYEFEKTCNSEVRFRWLRLGLLAHWKPIIPHVIKFVTEQGRLKFIKPLYRDMYGWDETRELAISTFQKNFKSMMYVATSAIARELHLEDAAEKKA